MSDYGPFLRQTDQGFAHYCIGCEEMHHISHRWHFNQDKDFPTFNPSVKITGKQTINVNGRWTGEWVRDHHGHAVDLCCHYFIKNGTIQYLNDCTHRYKGQTLPLMNLKDLNLEE